MAKKKALMTIPYPVYSMAEVDRLLTAGKTLNMDSKQLIDAALKAVQVTRINKQARFFRGGYFLF